MIFRGKKILIGICGGIAAYKVCWLIRSIKNQGGAVKTVLTRAGEHFVTPVTLEALSGEPAARELFDPAPAKTIQHIDLALWPDCFVIAPATANIIAKAAHGIADDLLSTIIVSYRGALIFAPAMNDAMWENPVTQENVKLLKKRNHVIIDPGTGALACDTAGPGRMAEPDDIERRLIAALGIRRDLAGRRLLITAGGTREPIDSVRCITNRSSGKMGAALAEAASARGAEVTLIAGSHTAPLPGGMTIVGVETAAEMAAAVKREIRRHDVLIMAAAVADYRPVRPAAGKIKKERAEKLELRLERTEDILKSAGRGKGGRVLVGFALETDNGIKNARRKLEDKNCDLIVLNNPLEAGAGFETDTNRVTLIEKGRRARSLPVMPKREAADRILDRIVHLLP